MLEPVTTQLEQAPPALTLREVVARFRGSSFLLNLFSVTGATIANRLIGLVTLGYAARVLGPEKYGLVGFGASVVAYAGILLSPGFFTWGTRDIARDRQRVGRAFGTVTLTEGILALIAYLGLVAFSLTRTDPSERTVILLCGLTLFSTALSLDWVFGGLEMMRIPATLSVPGALVSTVALLTLVRSPNDVYIYPLIAPLTGLLVSAGGYVILLMRLGIRPEIPGISSLRHALIDSLPLGITIALAVILHYANNLIIHGFLGSAELGIFLAAFRLLELAATIPGILASIFLPRLARVAAQAPGAASREARIFAQVHMAVAFFIAAFMLAEAPAIIALIYGARYDGAVQLLQILSIAVIFNFAICGYTNCLISFGQDRVMLLVVVTCTIVSVGGGFLLIPHIGVIGAAVSVAAIDLAGWLVSLPFYRRQIASLQVSTWLWPILGGLYIVTVCALLRKAGISVWLRVPAAGVGYVLLLMRDMKAALR